MPIKDCRPNEEIYRVAHPFDIESERIDGNDVLKVYDTAKRAVAHCRNRHGPFFIECLTYRQRGHVGPDDNIQGTHTDIRPESEIIQWKVKDPIIRYEKFLTGNTDITEDILRRVRNEITTEIEDAFEYAKKCHYPKAEELGYNVFK